MGDAVHKGGKPTHEMTEAVESGGKTTCATRGIITKWATTFQSFN